MIDNTSNAYTLHKTEGRSSAIWYIKDAKYPAVKRPYPTDLKFLQELELRCHFVFKISSQEDPKVISKKCRLLRRVRLSYATNLTPLNLLSKNSSCKELKTIQVKFTRHLTAHSNLKFCHVSQWRERIWQYHECCSLGLGILRLTGLLLSD